MEINTTAWHYRWYVYSNGVPMASERTSLCSYWKHVILFAPICFLIITAAYLCLGIMYLIGNILVIPSGVGFIGIDRKKRDLPLYTYKPVRIGADSYPVWFFVCFGWFLVFCAVFPHQVTQNFADDVQFVREHARFMLVLASLIVGMVAYGKFTKSDTGKLLRAYLKARKEGICPLVTFVDPNEPNDKKRSETEAIAS